MDAGHPFGARRVHPGHSRVGVRAPQDGRVEHVRERQIEGVAGRTADALVAVHSGDGAAHHLGLAPGFGLHRAAARCTAFTMWWYAPQRQRLPLMPVRISAVVGDGFFRSSASAATTWPGVQKPH